ncbi:hypothetical protein [Mesonia aestuariivivens]|uniref:Uncharacterized protein n=1 Tax=Mesonia aestuariivivens TaxID=2796128 RepID=A0ABS6W5L6_9FLAO|nr:hypothetical protein [Mesonia aestuariivivens]MBW2962807.1 hypothetical protein [Mesonia aestuariivivens]
MKLILLSIVLFVCGLFCRAQQASSSTTSTATNSSTSNSYKHSVANSEQKDENLSIAVSNSNDSYKFRASYASPYDQQVKETLIDAFGKERINKKGSWLSWVFSPSNDEIYTIEFSSGYLRMKLDKTQAGNELQQKFTDTGELIKKIISGELSNREDLILQRKSMRLEREAKRMQLEAKRLSLQERRNTKREEVKELREESDRLRKQVDSLDQEVKKLKEKP